MNKSRSIGIVDELYIHQFTNETSDLKEPEYNLMIYLSTGLQSAVEKWIPEEERIQ